MAGGASHSTNIFDRKFNGTRPPKIHEIIAEVIICNDIEKLLGKRTFKAYFEKRFFEFIESLGVEVNQYSMFTMVLLHELGHSNLIKLFLDVGMEKEFDNLYNMSKATVKVSGSYKQEQLWEATYGISLGQTCDVQENFADAYALKNFPKVWENIKEFVRPELTNKSNSTIIRYHERFPNEDKKYVKKVDSDNDLGTIMKELFG